MNRVFSTFLLLVWGAWFGSLIGIFIAVVSISMTFPISSPESTNVYYFGITTSGIFGLFERIQLCLAGGALLFAFAWQLYRGASRLKIALFVLFALATVGSVFETAYVSPKINDLRVQSETQSPEFKKMHGMSFGIYSANTLLLFVGGILLSLGIARETSARKELGIRA